MKEERHRRRRLPLKRKDRRGREDNWILPGQEQKGAWETSVGDKGSAKGKKGGSVFSAR
jgi:hypothetical protein